MTVSKIHLEQPWRLKRMLRGVVFLLVAIGIRAPADASHPFHVSIAEVEWNEEASNLEVALRVWPNDLEEALEDRFGRELNIEETDDIDSLIQIYLRERLKVTESTGRKAEIEWLGKEVSVKSAWLYFEIPLEQRPDGAEIENRLLFELLEDQANLVQFKDGRKAGTLQFNVRNSKQRLEYASLKFDIGGR